MALGPVVVTGAAGFLGWHLRARLLATSPDADVRVVDRALFQDDSALAEALRGAAAVVHLAGANRGSDDEVHATNVALARRLVEALEDVGERSHVIYANSTHAAGTSAYGRSKAEAAEILATWGHRVGAPVLDLVFPNLFGECGRPHYNSAVATFCHDLAEGATSDVNPDGQTELLHAQQAAVAIVAALKDGSAGSQRITGQPLQIVEVYRRLEQLRETYRAAEIPELADRLDLQLFNALRTAMFPAHYPLPLTAHRDSRGAFLELARGYAQTQTSFSTTAPGITRGEHFHFDKIERFVVLRGRATIKLRRLFHNEVVTFEVNGNEPVAIDMPPLFAHNITNIGDEELLTMFWANDHFDPAAPDTYPAVVEPSLLQAAR